MATTVVVILGILWIPIMQNISGVLYEYLQSVQAYIAPPITAVFLLGILVNESTARSYYYTDSWFNYSNSQDCIGIKPQFTGTGKYAL